MRNPILWAAAAALLALSACDNGGRTDLPQEDQVLDDGTAQVYLMPDRFPNVAHKCDGTTGLWTTTDRWVWIVYEDTACDGDGTGIVLDNVAGGPVVP